MIYKFFSTEDEYDEWFRANFKALVVRVDHTEHGILISYIKENKKSNGQKKK